MPKTKKRKHLKISNTDSKILLLFFLLSLGTVKNLNAQWCPHTPKCPFDSCYYGGDGLSEATAFQIWTLEHLMELSDSTGSVSTYPPPNGPNWTLGKHFRLMQDIDNVTQSIGQSLAYFYGHFYGGGHKITKITTTMWIFNSLYAGGSIDSLTVARL